MKQLFIWMVLAFAGPGLLSDRAPAATLATGSLTEAVYSLPADSGKLYLTVVGVRSDQQYQSLCRLFNETATPVRNETHYGQLDTRSTMYRTRYAKDYWAFPTVRLQRPDGIILQEYAGANIPADADLVAELKAECFRRRTSPRRVQPSPVQPVDTPVQPVNTKPRDQREQVPRWSLSRISWRVGLLAILIGAALGWRDESMRNKE